MAGKKADKRPARSNYWSRGTLKKNKVKRLMKHNGFKTEEAASTHWLNARKGRKK